VCLPHLRQDAVARKSFSTRNLNNPLHQLQTTGMEQVAEVYRVHLEKENIGFKKADKGKYFLLTPIFCVPSLPPPHLVQSFATFRAQQEIFFPFLSKELIVPHFYGPLGQARDLFRVT
jgi:hypothetical protein